jgi:hypothetical protein
MKLRIRRPVGREAAISRQVDVDVVIEQHDPHTIDQMQGNGRVCGTTANIFVNADCGSSTVCLQGRHHINIACCSESRILPLPLGLVDCRVCDSNNAVIDVIGLSEKMHYVRWKRMNVLLSSRRIFLRLFCSSPVMEGKKAG